MIEVVEEEVVEPVTAESDSSGNMQETISAEVQEEIKKAADAIKEKVTSNIKVPKFLRLGNSKFMETRLKCHIFDNIQFQLF